jgi:hypothetical protein
VLKGCGFEQARPESRALGWAGSERGCREFGGHTGRATLARLCHRVVERAGDTFVRTRGRGRKVSGPVLDLARVFCQFGVNRTTLARCRRGVYRGREHRVRVAHSIAGSLDEAAFDREGERLLGKVGSVASRRQPQKLSLRRRGQAADACEDRVRKGRRYAHGAADVAVIARSCEALAHDFERIERMTCGEVHDSLDLVTAEDPVRGLDDEFPNRLVGKRSYRELCELRTESEARAAGHESRHLDIEPS